jgi:D-alanyl-D-alanine carboxypeptidase
MKSNILLIALLAFVFSCNKAEMGIPGEEAFANGVSGHPKAARLNEIIRKYASKGIPGIVVAVDDADGYWTGSAGYARLEDKTRMGTGMLHYGFSITKIVTAVSVMQLKEAHKIDLDAPVRNYLPAEVVSALDNTDKITVRMLLNQTSGYLDYVRTNSYTLNWMDNPLKVLKKDDYYRMFSKTVKVEFVPGTDFLYSNTNYYLLALIIDHVTGKPHGEWYKEHIFTPLGLSNMYYKDHPAYPFYPTLPNGYASIKSNGKVQNISKAQQVWMQHEEYGTTGIIATSDNYIKLLKGLVTGKLVSGASLAEMKNWVTGSRSSEPDYGYGLVYYGYRQKPNFGHDGDGIGANALVLYFPTSHSYVFIATNGSSEFGGPMQLNLSLLKNEICEYLAGF